MSAAGNGVTGQIDLSSSALLLYFSSPSAGPLFSAWLPRRTTFHVVHRPLAKPIERLSHCDRVVVAPVVCQPIGW
jgi:hypothetical protein